MDSPVATLRYSANISNKVLDVTEPSAMAGAVAPQQYAMQWQRFEAYLGVRWFM